MNKPDKNDIIKFLKSMRDRCEDIECIECDMGYRMEVNGENTPCVTPEMLDFTIGLITGEEPFIKYAMPICREGTDEKFCSNCGESLGVYEGPVCKNCHHFIRTKFPFAVTTK